MATKTTVKKPTQPMKQDPKPLRVQRQRTETVADALAHMSLRPTVQAAITLMEYNKNLLGEISINTLVADLGKQCELASKGDLARAEALLTAQAHTLDALFNNLARRAALNLGEYMNATETYLRLALKAQGQCRATLETLAVIKNPQPVAFVRQANIACGDDFGTAICILPLGGGPGHGAWTRHGLVDPDARGGGPAGSDPVSHSEHRFFSAGHLLSRPQRMGIASDGGDHAVSPHRRASCRRR